jgi:hypothetical protein
MSDHCELCGSTELCTSRLRFKDIPRLIRFQYPMRCWVCRNRVYVSIARYLKVGRYERPEGAEVR